MSSIVKELAALYPPIQVREVLTEEIKRLFRHLNGHDPRERPQGKIELVPQKKWKRMIVLDPLMSKRYSFVLEHTLDSEDDRDYVRGLLFCSKAMRSYWERQFSGRRNMSWRDMSYQELNPEVLSSHR